MPEKMKQTIVQTARRNPEVTFIWKYEKEDDVGKGVENLVKTKWMPQNDLLSEFQQFLLSHLKLHAQFFLNLPIFNSNFRQRPHFRLRHSRRHGQRHGSRHLGDARRLHW